MEAQWDYVHFSTAAEDIVTSDTVRVRVKITCVASGKGASNLIPSVEKALAEVLPGAWQVIPGERKEDAAGMEQVGLLATIRVEETRTDGVVNRIRNINRGGMRMELDDIDYRPPQLAIGRVLADLRQEVYHNAQAEVARLNKSLTGDCGPWRVGKIQISERQDAVQAHESIEDEMEHQTKPCCSRERAEAPGNPGAQPRRSVPVCGCASAVRSCSNGRR